MTFYSFEYLNETSTLLEGSLKQIESTLISDETNFHSLVNSNTDICWKCDLEGRITYANEGWYKILRYSISEIIGKRFFSFVAPEVLKRDLSESKKVMNGASMCGYESTYITKDLQRVHLIISVTPLFNANGKITGTQGTAYDITELKQAENNLITIVQQAIEKEKERFAKDLHDGLGQILLATTINLKAIEASIVSKLEKEKQDLFRSTQKLIQKAIEETRNISHGLMSKDLNKGGLAYAIEEMCSIINQSGGISINFQHNCFEIRFDREIEITLYRIAQELINNIVKHSNASRVTIDLVKNNYSLCLEVKDNGIGMRKEDLSQKNSGIGLKNIQTRVKCLCGNFSIESRKNEGSSIKIRVPIRSASQSFITSTQEASSLVDIA